MPKFSADVPHTLGQADATDRLKDFVQDAQKRFAENVNEMDGSWNDNVLDFSLATFGMKITGTMTVDDSVVRVAGQLPLAAMPFRGKVEQMLAAELQQALS